MENVPNSPLGRLYREHIRLILDKDLEGVLNQYAEDAVLISSFTADRTPIYYRGREGLKKHFSEAILSLKSLEVDIAFWAETQNPDTLMIVEAVQVENVNGEKAKMRFADSWVLRDGKIAIHFAGLTQYPDGSIA
jgi:ketosteroid isomerase-like protein